MTTTLHHRYDPTDDHTFGGDLGEAQARRGVCSAPGCQWPIAGWCDEPQPVTQWCRAKFCYDHLQEHKSVHARQRHAALAYAHSIEELQRGGRA